MTQNNGSTQSPANMICAEEYVVKRGDSFYLISHKLGVPLRDLLAANRDIHPARLMVGDVLCIPREEDDTAIDNGSISGTFSRSSAPANSILSDLSNGQSNGTNNANGTGGMNGSNGTNGANGSGSTNGTNGMNGNNGTNGGNGTGETTETPLPSCPLEEQMTVQSGQTIADIQLRNLVSRNTLSVANPQVDLENLQAGQVLCVPTENIPCPIPATYRLCTDETLESVAIRFNLPVASLLRANPCLAPQDFEEGVSVILPQ